MSEEEVNQAVDSAAEPEKAEGVVPEEHEAIAGDVGDAALEGASTQPVIPAEKAEHYDTERQFHQQVWEQRAAARNESRPVTGIIRKTVHGTEQAAEGVMMEDAQAMDAQVDETKERHGDLNTRQEIVDAMPKETYLGGNGFFPGEDWRKEHFSQERTREESDYHGTIEAPVDKQAEDIIRRLEQGDILMAGIKYDDGLYRQVMNYGINIIGNRTREVIPYYDPRLKAALDKKVKPAVISKADSVLTQGEGKDIALLLNSSLCDLVHPSDLSTPQEQRRSPEVVEAVKQMAVEAIQKMPERDGDKILRPIFDRVTALGITDSFEDTVLIPELRQAALRKAIESAEGYYDSSTLRSLEKVGLVSPEEYNTAPEVIQITKDYLLGEIKDSDVESHGFKTSGPRGLSRALKFATDGAKRSGIVDPNEVISSTEGQQAAQEFVSSALNNLDRFFKDHFDGMEGSISELEDFLAEWENYFSKMKLIYEVTAPKGGSPESSEPVLPPELAERLAKKLAVVQDAVERYKILKADQVSETVRDAEDDFEEAKALGLAA